MHCILVSLGEDSDLHSDGGGGMPTQRKECKKGAIVAASRKFAVPLHKFFVSGKSMNHCGTGDRKELLAQLPSKRWKPTSIIRCPL